MATSKQRSSKRGTSRQSASKQNKSRQGMSNQGSRRAWTEKEVSSLRLLVGQNTPTRVIGLKLGRSESAVRSKATQEGISLKPTNQSPYNRK